MNRDSNTLTPDLRSWHCQIGIHINIPLANRIVQSQCGPLTMNGVRIVQVESTKDSGDD